MLNTFNGDICRDLCHQIPSIEFTVRIFVSDFHVLKCKAIAVNYILASSGKKKINLLDYASLCELVKSVRPFIAHGSSVYIVLGLKLLTLLSQESPDLLSKLVQYHVDLFISRLIELSPSVQDFNEIQSATFSLIISLIDNLDFTSHKLYLRPFNFFTSVSICQSLREVTISKGLFSHTALSILVQICVFDQILAVHCHLFDLLSQTVIDPFFQDMQDTLVMAIAYLLNHAFIYPHMECLNYILFPLTFSYSCEDLVSDLAIRCLVSLFKYWPGVIWGWQAKGIHSLVAALKHKSPHVVEATLNAFYNIFQFPLSHSFLFKNTKKCQSKNKDASLFYEISTTSLDPQSDHCPRPSSSYLCLLSMCFQKAELINTLFGLSNKGPRKKVSHLLSELLKLYRTLFPKSIQKTKEFSPILRQIVSSELDALLNFRFSTGISNLQKYIHLNSSDLFLRTNEQIMETYTLSQPDSTEETKFLNESYLVAKLNRTQVLSFPAKNWKKWEFKCILELLKGPSLRVQSLLQFTIKKTKFFKRLLHFFSPFRGLYSSLHWSPNNSHYSHVGTQLLDILMTFKIGCDYFKKHPFIQQISQILNEKIDSLNTGSTNCFLDEQKHKKTMSCDYFTVLGTLSRSKHGLEVLLEYKILNALQDICRISNDDGLINRILASFQYQHFPECRTILEAALSSSSPVIRHNVTKHFQQLLNCDSLQVRQWAIDQLCERVTLPDPYNVVSNLALKTLKHACLEKPLMEYLISKNISFADPSLGVLGHDLQISFLSLESGFSFLQSINFVLPEMEAWISKNNVFYAQQLESQIHSTLNPSSGTRNVTFANHDKTLVGPHFFGELSKTVKGCKLLQQHQIIEQFIKDIQNLELSPIEHRAVIWALAHLVSNSISWNFFKPFNVINLFTSVIKSSTNLSTKCTCFYAFGIMATLPEIRQILKADGWICNNKLSIQTVLPRIFHTSVLFSFPGHIPSISMPTPPIPPVYNRANYAAHNIETHVSFDEVIQVIRIMSNSVFFETVAKPLQNVKALHPNVFENPLLLFEVYKLMTNISLGLEQRRFIASLFSCVKLSTDAFQAFDQAQELQK